MARTEFGATFAAWLVTVAVPGDPFDVDDKVVILPPGDTDLDIYDAPDGAGTLVDDFLDAAGNPVSVITVPAQTPYIPLFSGPDDVTELWVEADTGTWLQIPHHTQGNGGGSGDGDVLLAGGNIHEYADSQSPPWLILRRPNDNTASSAWANMLEVYYFDNSTSAYRLGFYLNEKGLFRTRGTTPSDVPGRFIAHPSHNSNTAIFEVTLNDPNPTANKLLQFLPTQAVYRVPVVVPYVVNPLGERLYFGSADPETDPAYEGHRPDIGSGWIDYNNPPA